MPNNQLLLQSDQISKEFITITEKLDEIDSFSKNIKVEDQESLVVAENNVVQIKELLKMTNATHSRLKKPYFETGKAIDSYKKMISERLDAAVKRVAFQITSWRSVQEAAAREKLRKEQQSLALVEEEKTKEAAILSRLSNTINAKIYGGLFQTREGQEKTAQGSNTIEDCDSLIAALSKAFPAEDTFKYFANKRNDLLDRAIKDIKAHKMNLVELGSQVKGIRTAANNRINAARINAGVASEKVEKALEKKIESDSKKVIREGEKEIKEAARGTRKNLKFRVSNELEVTREFLSVDDSKIREWMEGKNDEIKKSISDGTQPIMGIEFYVEESFIGK